MIRAPIQILKNLVSRHLPGALVGVLLSSVIGVAIWAFAYFNYTNLGLPQRYDFEKIDHYVKRELPPHYTYKASFLENFRQPNAKSILVQAWDERLGDLAQKEVDSDLIIILDTNGREYEVTYKFQPNEFYPAHVRQLEVEDLDEDGRPEIIVGWSELGAHWADTFLTIFRVKEIGIEILGQPRLSNFEYPAGYKEEEFVNEHNKSERVTSVRSEYFAVRSGQIAAINRSREACYACVEEDLWFINFLVLEDSYLWENKQPIANLEGYAEMAESLRKEGYMLE
ncbi:MAG: hypothetical protein WD850_01410 [Candidatus Spechtbacterales bacterium]